MDTSRKISQHRKKYHGEQYYGPDTREVICPYCGKTLNATNRLFVHMKIQPQKGGWNTETCPKLIPEDTPRDKWAKLILRMKGNIPGIKLRAWEHKHSEEKIVIMQTKAADRQKEKNSQKHNTAKGDGKELTKKGRGKQAENNQKKDHGKTQKNKKKKGELTGGKYPKQIDKKKTTDRMRQVRKNRN